MRSVTVQAAAAGPLRALRIDAQLTQQQLAVLAGCSISYVGLLERGLQPTASDVLPRIRRILNEQAPGDEPRALLPAEGDGRDGDASPQP